MLGPDHPATLAAQNNLGLLYHDQGRYDETERLWRETLELRRQVLGVGHPATVASMVNMARVTSASGDTGAALGFLEEALDHGWAEASLDDDASLDPLRGDPAFEAIAAEVKRRIGPRPAR